MTKSIQRKEKHSSKRVQNNNPKTFHMESSSLSSESVPLIENYETTSKSLTCAKPTKSKSKDKIISSKKNKHLSKRKSYLKRKKLRVKSQTMI